MRLPKLLFPVVLNGVALAASAQTLSESPGAPEMNSSERVVFFSGQVMLDDGSAPPDAVAIEQVCRGGRTRFAAWTDARGHFGFKVDTGAGITGNGDASQPGAQPSDLNKPMGNPIQNSRPITSALKECELQAVLSGFRSERVSMALKSTMDNARIGTIILHPLSRASALTVSATTLEAPSNARKAYEKGLAAIRDQKWDAAVRELSKAVAAYPRYAIAWYELGVARRNRNDIGGAVEAWKEALRSDPKYIKPYENLTVAADRKEDWAESEKYSHGWLQLDPEDFPGAYLFNAIANARLNRTEEAERSAREGLRIDKENRIPRLHYVLGLILWQKHAYSDSAKCFRTYLELAPNAKDADIVRQQIPKIEKAARTAVPPTSN